LVLVEVKDAVFGYSNRPIVEVGELRVQPGGRLGMFGPNGCGKTTLVRGLTGLLPPMRGRVVRQGGLRVGYLPQRRTTDMHWPMSGADAASMALSARRRCGWIGAGDGLIDQKTRMLEVQDLLERPLSSLSGGQQQRLLLAGALAAEPQLLVLDEPTDGLDVRSRRSFLAALRRAAAEGLTTIMISHAIDDLVALCDEIAWFHLAEDAGAPNRIEIVPAAALAERAVALHRTT
jgi:ABC-type Mn2+/Zn2+ transport system ATPase subunit